MFEELFAGAILSISSAWITHLINVRKTRQEIKKIRAAYNLPAQIPFRDRRNTMLLIGIGGVGKTALINRLIECDTANPNERTENFKIYWQRVCNGDETNENKYSSQYESQSPSLWYYICDYCGQNIGSLFRAFIEQQKREYSPIAYGYVNSLILMVDLVAPPAYEGQKLPLGTYDLDTKRVSRNKGEWNGTAIDAVFGLLTDDLKYVCLFINKLDLMEKRSEQAIEIYKNSYKSIIDALKERQKYNKFKLEIIVGSALSGAGLPQLKEQLRRYSVSGVSKEREMKTNA